MRNSIYSLAIIAMLLAEATSMRLEILPKASDVGEWSAKYVMKRINDFGPGPDRYFVLGLPTGSTPLAMYKKLVEYYQEGRISFKYVKTFNMDEYVGKLISLRPIEQ